MTGRDDPLASFSSRLESVGDSIPVSDDEVGLAGVRRSAQQRQRRMRLLPVSAAAAVGIGAITVGVLSARSDDSLTVSSASTVSAEDSTTPSPPPPATASAQAPPATDAPPSSTTDEPDAVVALRTIEVDATVGDRAQPVTIDASPQDVTGLIPKPEQEPFTVGLPEGAQYQTNFEWLVEWRGGFLLGRSSDDGPGAALDVRFSPDGVGWEEIDVNVPDNETFIVDVQSTGDRLVVLANQRIEGRNVAAVFDSTDLVTWQRHPLPSQNPTSAFIPDDPIFGSVRGITLAVNDQAWAAQLRGNVELDVFRLVERIAGIDGDEISSLQLGSVGGASFDITFSTTTGDEQTVDIDLADDLGFSDGQVDAVEAGPYNEMWIGDWTDTTPVQVTDLPPGSFQGIVASDGAVAGWTSTHIGVVANGDDTMRVFSTRPEVAERSSITTVYSDGGDFVVHANDPSAFAFFDLLDHHSETWTPLDLTPLPATVRPEFGADSDVAVLTPQALPASVSTTASIDVGDYRYTNIFDPPFSTYELRFIETDEVVVSETIDIRFGSDPRSPRSRFLFAETATDRVRDPNTGEVLIELTDEQRGQLNQSRTTLDGLPAAEVVTLEDLTPRDDWLISINDGVWFLHDLPEPSIDENGNLRRSPNGLIERSGDILLVNTGDGWLRLEVG